MLEGVPVGGKMRENRPKTGISLAMSMGKWEFLDQNFGRSNLVFIFRHLITILLQNILKSKMLINISKLP